MRRKNKLIERKWLPFSRIILYLGMAIIVVLPLIAEENNEFILQTPITGTVIDGSTNEPLPGVTVSVKGTTRGVITDLDGKYSIVASSDETLVFSYVGYIKQEIPIGTSSQIDVSLKTEIVDLSEVIVVGYGTQKKSDLTGAITSVSEEMLKAQPVSSIDQALQGKAAGVIIMQTSGSPAGGVSIMVRGASSIQSSSQPLYVIDGIPISNQTLGGGASFDGGQGGQVSNPLASINPDDITNIEILKDASATAIYGSRGANGVILITTKRGKEGQNNLSFNMYTGFQQIPKKLNVLSSLDYARYRLMQEMNDINRDDYPNYVNQLDWESDFIPFSTLSPDSFPVSTNWQDEMYRTAPMQNYNLSANGGTEKMRYSLSGGYHNKDGILIGSSYERISLNANIDANLTKWFQMGNTLMVSYSKEDMTFNDAYYGGGLVERALQQRPDMPVYDEEGNYAQPPADWLQTVNPIETELEKQNDNVITRLFGNIYAQINFMEGLSLKSVFGSDISNARTTIFEPVNERIGRDKARMSEAIQQNLYWSWENYLTFTRKFADAHDISVMMGLSKSVAGWDQFSASRDDFPTDESRNLALGSTDNMKNGAYAGDVAMDSYFGRFIYSYKDFLTFTHTSRWDGSSKFGVGEKRSYFPSYALAWKISNHSFMQRLEFINFMKLRIGYGKTGNDNIDPTDYLARLSPKEVSFNNTVYAAYQPAGKDNPDLHWETVVSYNAGLDINMFDSRIQFTTDVYLSRSEDMLIQLPLPITSSPFGNPWTNSALMENRGIELSLVSHNLSGNFTWTTTASYSYIQNEVIDLKGTVIPMKISTRDEMLTQTAEGYPVAQFYGYVTDGLFRSQEEIDAHAFQPGDTRVGDIRFKDLNGDGYIDLNDKAYIGNPLPKHIFGLTNDFTWKNFDASIFLQGMAGNEVFNNIRRNMESMKGTTNQFPSVLNAYTPEDVYLETPYGTFLVAEQNTDTDMPRAYNADPNSNSRISDRYVEDASYLRIQTVTLGYTLPKNLTARLKGKQLRIYVSGKNLYTFTKYSGYEPEHGPLQIDGNPNALLSGIDIGNYPIPRSFVFGVNLDF